MGRIHPQNFNSFKCLEGLNETSRNFRNVKSDTFVGDKSGWKPLVLSFLKALPTL